jgi:hypothetical protein
MSVVTGLEETLRLKGIEFGTPRPDTQRSLLDSTPLITSAIAVLRSEKAPMGARAIHVALRHRGFVVNYSTLYKALQRESAKRSSALHRRGAKYELSESANNDTGTER